MRHNEKILGSVKNQLLEILNKIPDEFALEQTRSYLKKTIASINEVEKKRETRKANAVANDKQVLKFTSMEDAAKAIKLLDSMLEKEQKKIDKSESGSDQLLND